VITTYWLKGEINEEFPDLVPTNDAPLSSDNDPPPAYVQCS